MSERLGAGVLSAEQNFQQAQITLIQSSIGRYANTAELFAAFARGNSAK